MTDEEALGTPHEDRAAPSVPDPSGPPTPVEAADPVLNTISALGVGAVAVAGLCLAAMATTRPTMGATRSAKLEWERRQAQVEQAIQAQDAAPAPCAQVDAEAIGGERGPAR